MPVNDYDVIIRGVKYSMKTDKDLDFVNSVVDALNQRMKEIEKSAKVTDTQKIAVMAALSFAGEQIALAGEKGEAMGKVLELIDKTA